MARRCTLATRSVKMKAWAWPARPNKNRAAVRLPVAVNRFIGVSFQDVNFKCFSTASFPAVVLAAPLAFIVGPLSLAPQPEVRNAVRGFPHRAPPWQLPPGKAQEWPVAPRCCGNGRSVGPDPR